MTGREASNLEYCLIRCTYGTGDIFNPFYHLIKGMVKKRIASMKEKNRFLAGDLHLHTVYSDGMNSISQLVVEAKERGLDAVAITDHNLERLKTETKFRMYSKYFLSCKKSAVDHSILVIPGIEVSSTKGHILALFCTYQPSKEASRIKNGLSPEETIEQIHEVGGLAIAAHLYRKTGIGNYILKIQRKVDGIELNSPYRKRNLSISKELGVAEISGSDAHSRIGVGTAFTILPDIDLPLVNVEKELETFIEDINERRTVAYRVSSYDLLRNLDKTRFLSPLYVIRNLVGLFDDENRILSCKIENAFSK